MKVASFEKLKSDWNQTWFIDTIWDPLYVYVVKGHIWRSKVIKSQVVRLTKNVNFTSLESNLVYWYNVGIFTCSWGQCSQMKVKGSKIQPFLDILDKGHRLKYFLKVCSQPFTYSVLQNKNVFNSACVSNCELVVKVKYFQCKRWSLTALHHKVPVYCLQTRCIMEYVPKVLLRK